MNESQRTLVFLGLAAVSLIGARFAGPSAPKPSAEISGIGEPFYPDFKDADAAKSLEVINYNPETSAVKPFAIVQDKSGLWRIPYAHNYPADGKERLAKTAASMIGIKREGFAGRRDNEHADFGVLDPGKPEAASDLTGVGNRITLKDGDGKVLADYIIGKEVKGRSGMHYVRKPDEKATYIAKLDIQVSTKFADWIESDLLKIEASRLNMVAIDTTTVDADQRAVVEGELNKLTRKSSGDPWKMDGVDEATEELNQPEISKLVSALDDLQFVECRNQQARFGTRRTEDRRSPQEARATDAGTARRQGAATGSTDGAGLGREGLLPGPVAKGRRLPPGSEGWKRHRDHRPGGRLRLEVRRHLQRNRDAGGSRFRRQGREQGWRE